ncbi:hypothetical protein DFH06DRAFT_1345125 [Mycena polygramma]|nr:hypothetical protein DFH06DRAFT_1345125 [Mycena polygramma]
MSLFQQQQQQTPSPWWHRSAVATIWQAFWLVSAHAVSVSLRPVQRATAAPSLFGRTTANATQASDILYGDANTQGTGGLFGASSKSSNRQADSSGTLSLGTRSSSRAHRRSSPIRMYSSGTNQLGGKGSTNNIFGASAANKPALGGSLVLGAGNSLRLATSGQQQQPDAQTQFTRLTARIEGIAAVSISGYYFHNCVDPTQVNRAVRASAVRENPDPSWGGLVPAIAQAAGHQERVKAYTPASLSSPGPRRSTRTPPASRAAAQHTQLTHRLLLSAAHMHLVPALRASGMRAE